MVEEEGKRKRRKTRPLEDDSDDNESSDDDDSPPPSTARGTVRTRAMANGNRNANGSGRTNGHVATDGESDEDVYTASPRTTQRTGANGANGISQSQTSFASSIPASQALRTQSQSQSQSQSADTDEESGDSDLAAETAGLAIATEITAPRVAEFRSALGRVIGTPLFEDDCAGVEEVIGAVNERMRANGGPEFGREEAVKALEKLDEANAIM